MGVKSLRRNVSWGLFLAREETEQQGILWSIASRELAGLLLQNSCLNIELERRTIPCIFSGVAFSCTAVPNGIVLPAGPECLWPGYKLHMVYGAPWRGAHSRALVPEGPGSCCGISEDDGSVPSHQQAGWQDPFSVLAVLSQRKTKKEGRKQWDSNGLLLWEMHRRLAHACQSWVWQIITPTACIKQIPGLQPTHLPVFLLGTEKQHPSHHSPAVIPFPASIFCYMLSPSPRDLKYIN